MQSCSKCGKEKSNLQKWAGSYDSLNAVRMRNSLPLWCSSCTLKSQLKYAIAQSFRIPLLLLKLMISLIRDIAKKS